MMLITCLFSPPRHTSCKPHFDLYIPYELERVYLAPKLVEDVQHVPLTIISRLNPPVIASVSVGTPDDPLEDKLKAISSAGFTAIELGFPDLLSFAKTFHNKEMKEDDYGNLYKAGIEVKALCKKHNLRIMMLQPFSNFEGWEPGSKERGEAFERARGWIEIMHAVGTDMLQVHYPSLPFLPAINKKQVGSSDSPNISTDLDILASDLRELADLLAPHGYRLAYEN